MPQVLVDKYSERRCVVQMGKPNQLVEKDTDDTISNYDISEYAYSNRELVNLENANVNIDNSNDVIIGPVTQFNVSGNVTIVQNGQSSNSEEKNTQKWSLPGEKCTEVTTIKSENVNDRIRCCALIVKRKRTFLVMVGMSLLLTVSAITIYEILQYLIEEEGDEPYYGSFLGNHSVFYRDDWGGEEPIKRVFLPHPVSLVVISHSATKPCGTFMQCSRRVRFLQKYYFKKGKNDVAYNFMIGGDGDIYVGRGWDVKNVHDQVISIGIDFIGNFNIDPLNDSMINAALALLEQGMSLKKLSKDFILVGHNQSTRECPDSPGKNVYEVIKTWPHFSNKSLYEDIQMLIVEKLRLSIYNIFRV